MDLSGISSEGTVAPIPIREYAFYFISKHLKKPRASEVSAKITKKDEYQETDQKHLPGP